jgi:hypothetical protein
MVDWGNLVLSIRDAWVTTVAEYLRLRSRYQVSKLGGRLHREARAILAASEGAREVARELLGRIVRMLTKCARASDRSAHLQDRRRGCGSQLPPSATH